jgi:DNA-binding response OmpR family regulator
MNLLIVEDNPALGEVIELILRMEGYKVFLTSMPSTAMETLRSEEIDGIVSDIRMPGMSGIDFGKVLRKAGISIPIVYFSAEMDGANFYKDELIEIGNTRFIAKPSPPSDLVEALREILQAH